MDNNENMMELSFEEMEQVSGGAGSGQRIKATGDVHVRAKPDKESESLGILYKGESVPFKGEIRIDDRGVYWGKVSFKGHTGWVSSKYAKIVK